VCRKQHAVRKIPLIAPAPHVNVSSGSIKVVPAAISVVNSVPSSAKARKALVSTTITGLSTGGSRTLPPSTAHPSARLAEQRQCEPRQPRRPNNLLRSPRTWDPQHQQKGLDVPTNLRTEAVTAVLARESYGTETPGALRHQFHRAGRQLLMRL
jgi:hypothetical protein